MVVSWHSPLRFTCGCVIPWRYDGHGGVRRSERAVVMALAAGDGVVLQDQFGGWMTFTQWLVGLAVFILLFIIVGYVMTFMGWDRMVSVVFCILFIGLTFFSLYFLWAEDTAKTNESALNSSYGVSDVCFGGGGGIGELMAHPKDGSWRVTYKDSKGGRRNGRMEIIDSQSGSPTIRMMDDSGHPLNPHK